jgi:hypothetical protein
MYLVRIVQLHHHHVTALEQSPNLEPARLYVRNLHRIDKRKGQSSRLKNSTRLLLDAFFTVSPHHPHTKFASWWSISAPVWRNSQWMKKDVKRRGLVDCQSIYTVLGGCPQLASPVSTRCTHMISVVCASLGLSPLSRLAV